MQRTEKAAMEKRFQKFSVPLGLLDYVNPILYSVTMVTVLKNLYSAMARPFGLCLLIGAIISIVFGFVIPTGKVIVGLGIVRFVMPVSLVFCVNTGILLSGLALFQHVTGLVLTVFLLLVLLIAGLLILVYFRSKKINTVAVLTGAAGYLLIYASLITLSARCGRVLPVVLYAFAIGLFVMLCGIGIKANLKDPRIHWIIEISNVLCQLLVAIGTVVLFSR